MVLGVHWWRWGPRNFNIASILHVLVGYSMCPICLGFVGVNLGRSNRIQDPLDKPAISWGFNHGCVQWWQVHRWYFEIWNLTNVELAGFQVLHRYSGHHFLSKNCLGICFYWTSRVKEHLGRAIHIFLKLLASKKYFKQESFFRGKPTDLSKNFPTYPWNIPQTPNQQFMKEFLSFGGLGKPGVCSRGMLGFS